MGSRSQVPLWKMLEDFHDLPGLKETLAEDSHEEVHLRVFGMWQRFCGEVPVRGAHE